jgi:hypothetical protein
MGRRFDPSLGTIRRVSRVFFRLNNNGISDNFLCLDNTNYDQRQVFPAYPNAAVNCPRGPEACTLPDAWKQYATSDISAFWARLQNSPGAAGKCEPGEGTSDGFTGTLSYLYVHGVDMIRARDVNLPPPTYYSCATGGDRPV